MARAHVVEDLDCEVAGFLVILDLEVGKDWGELFVGIGVALADAVLMGDEDAGAGGNAVEMCELADLFNAVADDRGVHGAVGAEDKLAELGAALRPGSKRPAF